MFFAVFQPPDTASPSRVVKDRLSGLPTLPSPPPLPLKMLIAERAPAFAASHASVRLPLPCSQNFSGSFQIVAIVSRIVKAGEEASKKSFQFLLVVSRCASSFASRSRRIWSMSLFMSSRRPFSGITRSAATAAPEPVKAASAVVAAAAPGDSGRSGRGTFWPVATRGAGAFAAEAAPAAATVPAARVVAPAIGKVARVKSAFAPCGLYSAVCRRWASVTGL